MKNLQTILLGLLFIIAAQSANGQPNDLNGFMITGKNQGTIRINQKYTATTEIFPFGNINLLYGLAVSANIDMNSDGSLVRIILVDNAFNEFLIYEAYPLLEKNRNLNLKNVCEETSVLGGVKPYSVKIEITDAQVDLTELTLTDQPDDALNIPKAKKDKKQAQDEYKIGNLNNNIKDRGQVWAAGITEVSEMSFSDRKKLYGQSKFPAGFEYYTGGIIQDGLTLKSATATLMVSDWDWRNRHGKNWISPVKNQASCGSCWAFAATGATEAQVNLYFNQVLNLDLAEQDVLSCSGAGSCSGGWPDLALDYIRNTGIVNEGAFPYTATNQSCSSKSSSPSQLIKIAGRVDFGSTTWPKTEDNLKKMIIKYGPISGGIYDWSHAMTLVGWKTVKQGDYFYTRDLNKSTYWITIPAGSSLIGTTVWIFKNSWGSWGDAGYVYVQTSMSNVGWTHALLNPVQSLKQTQTVFYADNDKDGYYWWGLGPKPAGCPGPDTADGNDNNAALGPLDAYGNCIPLNTAPIAAFTSNKTTVTQEGTVAFTDQSSNAPTSWSWQFQGGTPSVSSAQNPTVTYSTVGTYNVILTVTNSYGSGTVTKTAYIKVNPPAPVADFTANKTTITTGESISFTDNSTNTPTSWSWQFSGGTPATSTLQNPVVTYSTAGSFTVVLTATNAGGSGTSTKTAYIKVNPPAPVANFSANQTSVSQGATINYTDLSTNLPTLWNWQFQGGTPSSSTVKNPSVTYNLPGSYTVTLTVTNGGGSGTLCRVNYITVNSAVPVADFSSDKTTLFAGGTVSFTDLSTNGPTSWSWIFSGGSPGTSNQKNPVVTYNYSGVYDVILIATNTSGSGTVTKTSYITVNALTYCSSSGVNYSSEWIKSVKFNGIVNASGASGYTDFTSIKFPVIPGKSYQVTLTPGYIKAAQENWGIWVDVNMDGDFDDTGEKLLTMNKKNNAFNANIVIPAAIKLPARMRISMKHDAAPLPCEVFPYGEVEDYMLVASSSGTLTKSGEIAGTDGNFSGSFNFYPNPVNDNLYVELNGFTGQANLSILNSQGAQVMKHSMNSFNEIINLSNLSSGLYLIVVENGGNLYQGKFVKN